MNLLEELGAQDRSYLVAFCPFHEDRGRPNFVVFRTHGICFRCGAKAEAAQILDLVRKGELVLARNGGRRGEGRGKGGGREDLESLAREAFQNLWSGALKSRQTYLRERGIGPGFAQSKGIGHTGSAFLIPFRDREGRLVGAKLRADPAFELSWRYRNWPGTPSLLYRPFPDGSPSVLVEGEFDALLLAQWGFDAMSPSTGVWGLRSLRLPKKRLFLLLDWDEAGETVAKELESRGIGIRVERPDWAENAKDIGEALGRLPLEDRFDGVLEILRRAAGQGHRSGIEPGPLGSPGARRVDPGRLRGSGDAQDP